ncbi:site-2 protease family protein [Methanobrevibacter sp. OttesenSCG-928-K11]|nr:site-2 protease family protein [Methanobrevibacter sp. OttesenSCG-928-K11]MDL2271022.1 site-2 protease family protein [Methanobrevibacter sp. OttesenSCG-928-I08]
MFKFTRNEIRDLIISFLVISLGFAIMFSNGTFSSLELLLPISMVGVGIGFIFHEIAHKLSSMHYGYWAEYKLWAPGLVLALVSALFFGIMFAAPGAVYTYGNNVSKEQNGIISLAGPVTNIAIALIFLLISVLIYPLAFQNSIIALIFLTLSIGFSINSFLAVFNLLPFGGLDGSKVLRWNPIIWIISIAIAGIMTYFSMTLGVETIVRMILGI